MSRPVASPRAPAGDHRYARSRGVTAVLGPTNTGKTHLAIERMTGHETGLIGLPLRLLAREVYDKVAAKAGAANVALITGEEKIKPLSPRYWVCTVEAMPLETDVDFLAIDEIQLAADGERGHVFTDRLLHARGAAETLMLGAATMQNAVRDLLPGANIVSRPRLSTLSYAGQKKISRLPRRSAIVAFTATEVYAIAELIRRQRGGAAVVLGALSPRTRNAQVELYQNGDVDFLVATDAIGMGLNLDLDHVAFASVRKFDGLETRQLTPAEMAQIAGRAGRHMNDGTFGVTADVEPFGPELVNALENHEFEPVKVLQWRNRDLDFSSLEALMESLRAPPRTARLARARMVDDVTALETLSRSEEVRRRAVSPAAVRMLWDACQIPDYPKISAAAHAELVARIYGYIVTDPGLIPEDWFAQQVGLADRTDGDIDTIAGRIAHIRTWTFVSHRGDWLADPGHWQERARAIEDKLSDALHDKLTRRFVDRRTSVLMKRLRDREELYAEIGSDGAVHVERHFVGRLNGFRFTPDTRDSGVHGKAARHAAARVLSEELNKRADRLAGAADDAFKLTRTGSIEWEGEAVAVLERGESALKPGLRLLADEHLSGPDKERVESRLAAWLEACTGELLKPLLDMNAAGDITGLARGVAFRLTESLGILKREDVSDDIKALDQDARGQLRKYGVRFGAFNIYVPVLLKPAASDLIVLLWTLHDGAARGLTPETVPELPRQGLTSAPADPNMPEEIYRAAGFHVCGKRLVRIDMLERLADMIRPLVAWRPDKDMGERPDGSTGDGAFRVRPDMMSIVGCSGEDFASILTALGFRRERKPLPAEDAADASPAAAETAGGRKVDAGGAEAAAEAPADAPPETQEKTAAEPKMDEVWRPQRKKPKTARSDIHRPGRARGKAVPRKDAGRSARRDKGKPKRDERAKRPGQKRREERKPDPDSPFAALASLKASLEDSTS